MEDAFVIAHLTKKHGLSKTDAGSTPTATSEQLQQICKDYQEQRGKRVGDTVLRARKRAAITHALEGMEQTEEWYGELAKEDGMHIMEGEFSNNFDTPYPRLTSDVFRHVENNPRSAQRTRQFC